MKVILQQDVKSLGKKGDLVNASDGYARNFLLPRKLASVATTAALRQLAAHKEKIEEQIFFGRAVNRCGFQNIFGNIHHRNIE